MENKSALNKWTNPPGSQEESGKCKTCGELADWDGYCTDCWPGYNLCADPRCEHYRCEHAGPEGKEECGNAGCPCKVFVENSEKRVVTKKEWAAIRESWQEGEELPCSICGGARANNFHVKGMSSPAMYHEFKNVKAAELRESTSPPPDAYNHAYQFMHAWLIARNPKYANHKLTVRMRRNRLAELLAEYKSSAGVSPAMAGSLKGTKRDDPTGRSTIDCKLRHNRPQERGISAEEIDKNFEGMATDEAYQKESIELAELRESEAPHQPSPYKLPFCISSTPEKSDAYVAGWNAAIRATNKLNNNSHFEGGQPEPAKDKI